MKYDAFITFVEKVIILILGLLILTTGYKIFALGLVFVFATVVSIFFSIFFLIKNFTKVKLMFEWEIQKELIRISYPLALMALFGVICMKTDTIMLSLIKDNIAVSLYNAPYKIIEGFTFIPILFMNSVFPIMSQLSNKNKSFRKSIRYSMFGLALVSIPLTIICMLFSKKIIYIIYGNNYLVASTTFSVLILSLVFIFLVRPIGYALFAKNKQKIVLYAQIVASFINISLNLYFIPRLSFLGAAITTLITQIFIFIVLSTYAVKKRYIF